MTSYPRLPDPAPAFDRVAALTLETPVDAVPQPAQDWAAMLLLDTLGVAAAAARMEAGRLARETAVRLYGAAGQEPPCTLMFDGRDVSLAGAGFALGSQIDNLDAHDGYAPVKGHIAAAVVPALVAIAQSRPEMSGAQALAAMCIAYEVAGRAGSALHATVPDYHTSGAWNALGVAALAARLRGASPSVLRDALGIAEYHGPRSQMMREIANPTMLHDGSGMGAFVGLSAIVMAELSFTGAPAITVEGPDAAPFWKRLGDPWVVTRQYVKPYPICRWAHAPIDGAKLLRDRHGITHDMIDRIEIASFDNAIALFGDLPQTTSQAQYSLAFSVAAMLVHGQVGLDQIAGAGLEDRDVARLVQRTHLRREPRHEARFPEGRWADLTLVLKDGRSFNSGDIDARGGVDSPFDRAAIIEKFHQLAAPVLGDSRSRRIETACFDLQKGAPFSALTELLFAPPG